MPETKAADSRQPDLEHAATEASTIVKLYRPTSISFTVQFGHGGGEKQPKAGAATFEIKRFEVQGSGNLFDQLIVLLTPLLEGGSPLSTKAELVYGAEGDPNIGELDPIRAEYIGIPNGERFILEGASGFTRWSVQNLIGWGSSSRIEVPDCSFFSCSGGDIYVYAQDCLVLGIDSCFDLDIYNSFPVGEVGEVNGERRITGPADGAFISFQTKDLDWLKDVKKTDFVPEDFIRATSGAFFNIPNGATEVNLNEALYGTQRYRTEYIDRGKGLF